MPCCRLLVYEILGVTDCKALCVGCHALLSSGPPACSRACTQHSITVFRTTSLQQGMHSTQHYCLQDHQPAAGHALNTALLSSGPPACSRACTQHSITVFRTTSLQQGMYSTQHYCLQDHQPAAGHALNTALLSSGPPACSRACTQHSITVFRTTSLQQGMYSTQHYCLQDHQPAAGHALNTALLSSGPPACSRACTQHSIAVFSTTSLQQGMHSTQHYCLQDHQPAAGHVLNTALLSSGPPACSRACTQHSITVFRTTSLQQGMYSTQHYCLQDHQPAAGHALNTALLSSGPPACSRACTQHSITVFRTTSLQQGMHSTQHFCLQDHQLRSLIS